MGEPNTPGRGRERGTDGGSTNGPDAGDRATDERDANRRSMAGRDDGGQGSARAAAADRQTGGPGSGGRTAGDPTRASGGGAGARTGERRTAPRIGYRQVGEVAWRSILSLVVIGLLVAIVLGMGFLVYEDRLAAEPLVLLVGLLAGYLLGRLETYF